MQWRNRSSGYGLLAVILHWVSAVLVVSLFVSGTWMVSLTYYDHWYKLAPHWHKSVGLLLLFILSLRLILRGAGEAVQPLSSLSPLEKRASLWGHRLLYGLLILVPICGFAMSTADGRGVSFFNLFTVPPFPVQWSGQKVWMGVIHEWAALVLIVLAGSHGLVALKHQYRDGMPILQRMGLAQYKAPSVQDQSELD